jgi:hypothetical protein
MKKPKVYTYPITATWTDNTEGVSMCYVTQLYQIGVYMAVYAGGRNGVPVAQLSQEPKDMVHFLKVLNKLQGEDKISNLELGGNVSVSEVDGFWKEVG